MLPPAREFGRLGKEKYLEAVQKYYMESARLGVPRQNLGGSPNCQSVAARIRESFEDKLVLNDQAFVTAEFCSRAKTLSLFDGTRGESMILWEGPSVIRDSQTALEESSITDLNEDSVLENSVIQLLSQPSQSPQSDLQSHLSRSPSVGVITMDFLVSSAEKQSTGQSDPSYHSPSLPCGQRPRPIPAAMSKSQPSPISEISSDQPEIVENYEDMGFEANLDFDNEFGAGCKEERTNRRSHKRKRGQDVGFQFPSQSSQAVSGNDKGFQFPSQPEFLMPSLDR